MGIAAKSSPSRMRAAVGRRGLASENLREALRRPQPRGFGAFHPDVAAGDRSAWALCGELGFVVVGQRPRYYRNGEGGPLRTRRVERGLLGAFLRGEYGK